MRRPLVIPKVKGEKTGVRFGTAGGEYDNMIFQLTSREIIVCGLLVEVVVHDFDTYTVVSVSVAVMELYREPLRVPDLGLPLYEQPTHILYIGV